MSRTRIAAAALMVTTSCWAQTAAPGQQLAPVQVTGRATPQAGVAGWGDIPLAATPLQASVTTTEQLKDRGAQRLSDLTRIDPAVSDAYNAEGYWDNLTVRGFVLDNRFNFRRDGLPISAETSIPLDNKAQLEILKGTSGMQTGTSAPGGLANFVVKRPLAEPLRRASLEWREAGSVTGAIDLNQRFGADEAFGLRLNAAAARLEPKVRAANGDRHLLAAAAEWRMAPGTLIEAEFETSHQSQPSVPGFSLLGSSVPQAVDPRINLNNQPWSLPVVFDANTASLRVQQQIGERWRATAHWASQQLRTDDRIAFPFGCTDPNPPPNGTYYPDRYCPNGNLDLYDYRSENEHRRTDALDLNLQGRLQTGSVGHALTAGALNSRVRNRFQGQAFNFAGTGNVDGTAVTPSAPDLTAPNTNRDERSTELYLRDAIALSERFTTWLGLRHTRLKRDSVGTDGSEPISYSQSFTTPFVAASYAYAPDRMAYASWGQGVESEVVPNQPCYANGGQALPALKSRQAELGLKGSSEGFEWGIAAFDVAQPQFSDAGSCASGDVATRTRSLDGTQRHRGVEATAATQFGLWRVAGGAQWLRARREGSSTGAIDGLEPTNVPARTLKLQAAYRVAQVPGLSLQAASLYESRRMVVPDNSASIPGYARLDLATRYDTDIAGHATIWRAGVDNVADRRAWRESPYQFGHAYLFPLAPRTLRLSVQLDL
jgi:iron complex outermembrane recepter protein